ncbi:hypothetical protein V5O48_006397 [Marasmius crinis-equi]|uniref:BIR-domain-containing protein n=1 Tax=Marasmius crinis-equi TaxID=585013 RepID=A0ABR3FJU0_9AGAR
MNLHVLQARIDSFTKSKKSKGSSKGTSGLKWPHPSHFQATPETLAEAGFYFEPSPGDNDNVTCYMCNKQLSEWAEDDDPFEIHFEKCGKKCGWASVVCGIKGEQDKDDKFTFKDKNRLPTSKAMEKARLQTFTWENLWPHDNIDNHGANSKKMARAGFIYIPSSQGDDTASCAYCGVLLSGWEEEDDPMEEHRKRVMSSKTTCPMFPDIGADSLKASTSKSRSKSKAHNDLVMPTKDYDGPDDEEAPAPKASTSTKTPKKPKTSSRGAKTPAARARSSSRSRQTPADEHDEDEESEAPSRGVTPAPSKPQKPAASTHKRTRSRSKSVAPPQTDTEEEVSAPAPARTRTRAKSKGVAETDSDDQSTKAKVRARSKSKARVSVIPEDDAAEKGHGEDEGEQPRPTRTAKGKAASTQKPSASVATETPEEPPQPRTRKNSRAPKPKPVSTASTKTSQLEALGASTTKKLGGGHKRTASSASQTGKARAVSPPEEIDLAAAEDELDVVMQGTAPSPPPPPPPEKQSKVKSKSKPAPAVESEPNTDIEMVDPAPHAPIPTSKTNRPPLSRVPSTASKAPSSTGSEVSRSKVKALASRYESEEPASPPKPRSKTHQPSHPTTSQAPSNPVRPASRNATTAKPAVKPPSSNAGSSRSGSDRERRDVMQIVQISSDEEDEDGARTPSPKKPKKKLKKPTAQEEEKENKRGEAEQIKERERSEVQHVHEPVEPKKVDGQTEESKPFSKKAHPKENREEPKAAPAPIPPPPTDDVDMVETQPDSPHREVQIPVGRPVTPPPTTSTMPSFPPKTPFATGPKGQIIPPTPGFQFCPPLAKEPFVNLEVLSNEELDMTVEDWIRCQMNVEYEKFKRDGEDELAAFQNRAEEVRRTIEAL